MVIIETNSCPSGQKSTPLFEEMQEYGGYKFLIERSFLPRLEASDFKEGELAVIFDKNPMESSGYAACLADLTGENVHLVPCFSKSEEMNRTRWTAGHLEVCIDVEVDDDDSDSDDDSRCEDKVVLDLDNIHLENDEEDDGMNHHNKNHQRTFTIKPGHNDNNRKDDDDSVSSNGRSNRSITSTTSTGSTTKTYIKKWIPIRGCIRYVTQRPWNRIPVKSKTVMMNSVLSCLAGGRNKLVAAKAYETYNTELAISGLQIETPLTVRDVEYENIPKWVNRMGGYCAIKIPYSNAGQGVYTITNESEFQDFLKDTKNCNYERYVVQSLISNHEWSSSGLDGTRLFHVGTMPDKKGKLFVADLRMMVSNGKDGFKVVGMYARKTKEPLAKKLPPGTSSWDMLGTNLSVKISENYFSSEPDRLLLMDRKDFNTLGMGLDDLIDAYVQTCLSVVSIDKMSKFLAPNDQFDMNLFKSVCPDDELCKEIEEGNNGILDIYNTENTCICSRKN